MASRKLFVKWLLHPADPVQVASLAEALPSCGIKRSEASTLARLLLARDIASVESAHRFLTPSLDHLHSPYEMLGMTAAVGRLCAAIARKEPILIYGDYDVDGTTAIVILKTAIELCGGIADFHVPHRIRDGYGMKDDVIERAADAGTRLIISVDTGIRAFAAADTARRAGVDLIVTDHHLPGPEGVPQALAVLNPNQAGCGYPSKELCGAGVAFKLAQALLEKQGRERLLPSFLKIVAIATIADAVPLTNENRVFAKLGLEGLRRPVNVGLKALLELAQVGDTRAPTAGEVAFRIAPRINAAGRMDVARDVIELFTVKDAARARDLAARLDHWNSERQLEERRIMEEIEKRLADEPALRDAYCMVIDGDRWHRGVIGITATRVVERYCRPALVISREGDEAHGSGRSIPAFHLLDAMESCAELFTRYGGHAHACGFALPCEKVPDLRARLDTYARARLTPADFQPVLELESELPLDQVTPELFAALRRMEPFGIGNPQPVFSAHGVRLAAPPKLFKDKHVKLKLGANHSASLADAPPVDPAITTPRCHPDSAALRTHDAGPSAHSSHTTDPAARWRRNITFSALGWRLADRIEQEQVLAGDTLDIAYTIEVNEHPEFGGLELSLRDFRRTRTPEDAVDTKGLSAKSADSVP
jgi:single-stranded-DNA-specific exonuclease